MYNNNLLEEALVFSFHKHQGQYRRISNLPYFTHPLYVSFLIDKYVKRNKTRIIKLKILALLHDILEDTDVNFEELETKFGLEIADNIQNLTNDKELCKGLGKKEYLKYKILTMENDELLVKLTDRLHNILDNPTNTYLIDTLEVMNFLKNMRSDIERPAYNIASNIEVICRLNINYDL
jgi:(p)ppGpp synthase/HD superfamily hydrolase